LKFLQSLPSRNSLFLLMIFTILSTIAFGQNIMEITGTVKSANDGRPLSGVSVGIKNTTNGTVTDASGIFNINTHQGSVLVFSYIGFQTKEIQLHNDTKLN